MAALAAALLSIGASMTSLAAQGWQEEGGEWVFYNKDGSLATDQWKKSGNNWYWLESDGVMAKDMIIEDDDDYFYVDANGVMVTNEWVKVENTDDDGDDAPSNWWYYLGGNGKAYKANENGNTSLKLISGKKYAFTEEGKMLFGWVDESSTRQTDDDAWASCMYYMGGEDDGAATIGWAQIPVIDDNTERWDKKGEESEDQDYWFYFQSNGKKLFAGSDEKLKIRTINGKKYGFDETGRMVFEWVDAGGSTPGQATGTQATSSSATNGYNYFSDRDSGARVSKGWFKVVPDENINWADSDDDEERWYYAYSVGKLCASEFKTINGKRYAFDNSGRMLTGLQAIYTDGSGRVWNRELDEESLLKDASSLKSGGVTDLRLVDEEGKELEGELLIYEALENCENKEDEFGGKRPTYGIYCFGSADDGGARTSTQNVSVDGDIYTFFFEKSGDKKGRGINGIKDNYLYREGVRVKADKDSKYEAYFIAAKPWNVNGVTIDEGSYQDAYEGYCGDEDSYFLPGHAYYVNPDYVNRMVADIKNGTVKVKDSRIYLVNTSGNISKGNKDGAKDGNDCYYSVKDGKVTGYYSKEGGDKTYIGMSPSISDDMD